MGTLHLAAAHGLSSDATVALQSIFNNRYFTIPEPTSCYACSDTEVYSVLINHINLLFHFVLRDANSSKSQDSRIYSQKDLLLPLPTRCLSRHPRGPVTSGHPLFPQGCPEALSNLPFKQYTFQSGYSGFYLQLETC